MCIIKVFLNTSICNMPCNHSGFFPNKLYPNILPSPDNHFFKVPHDSLS